MILRTSRLVGLCDRSLGWVVFWKPTQTTQPTLSPVPPNPEFSGGGGGGNAAILGASCKAGSTSDGSMGKSSG